MTFSHVVILYWIFDDSVRLFLKYIEWNVYVLDEINLVNHSSTYSRRTKFRLFAIHHQ